MYVWKNTHPYHIISFISLPNNIPTLGWSYSCDCCKGQCLNSSIVLQNQNQIPTCTRDKRYEAFLKSVDTQHVIIDSQASWVSEGVGIPCIPYGFLKAFQDNTWERKDHHRFGKGNLSRAMGPHSLQADDPEKKMPGSNRGLNPALKGKVF